MLSKTNQNKPIKNRNFAARILFSVPRSITPPKYLSVEQLTNLPISFYIHNA
jgi:hypothetical protein